ncbi:hypothetical protein AMAG_13860 [Allomyces macrogynus ATCC 38327]|uniref:Uncharacterized protein n=1 Tax=Allomyces macrogynus (strain ATCC 38327) TaxID=578462 RepID=A0A0L0T2N3_ALLM3|nr:hypothetical protein AMAG_13860 [Allomyces macrogynus ATCC 38327]|eukprot:KNE68986.1 hypothetical protein AMAG_13860 [Allomyces macrogynus ATCC 38327]
MTSRSPVRGRAALHQQRGRSLSSHGSRMREPSVKELAAAAASGRTPRHLLHHLQQRTPSSPTSGRPRSRSRSRGHVYAPTGVGALLGGSFDHDPPRGRTATRYGSGRSRSAVGASVESRDSPFYHCAWDAPPVPCLSTLAPDVRLRDDLAALRLDDGGVGLAPAVAVAPAAEDHAMDDASTATESVDDDADERMARTERDLDVLRHRIPGTPPLSLAELHRAV